jgi:hypothetical protein
MRLPLNIGRKDCDVWGNTYSPCNYDPDEFTADIEHTATKEQYLHRKYPVRTAEKKRRKKGKARESKKGAYQQQTQPPSDVGRGNNNEIEGGTNTGDTEMIEVETSHQQKQGG